MTHGTNMKTFVISFSLPPNVNNSKAQNVAHTQRADRNYPLPRRIYVAQLMLSEGNSHCGFELRN